MKYYSAKLYPFIIKQRTIIKIRSRLWLENTEKY